MPKKLNFVKTIFVIMNSDKTVLSAHTSEAEAKKEIELKYSIIPEKFILEPCGLNIDDNFIEEIKKRF